MMVDELASYQCAYLDAEVIFIATKYLEEHLGVDVDHVVAGAEEDVDEWAGAIIG